MKAKHRAAFPRPVSTLLQPDGLLVAYGQTGMSIRQYYAGLAMQALIGLNRPGDPQEVAKAACLYADDLISELDKT